MATSTAPAWRVTSPPRVTPPASTAGYLRHQAEAGQVGHLFGEGRDSAVAAFSGCRLVARELPLHVYDPSGFSREVESVVSTTDRTMTSGQMSGVAWHLFVRANPVLVIPTPDGWVGDGPAPDLPSLDPAVLEGVLRDDSGAMHYLLGLRLRPLRAPKDRDAARIDARSPLGGRGDLDAVDDRRESRSLPIEF